jgi:hypothetical protein
LQRVGGRRGRGRWRGEHAQCRRPTLADAPRPPPTRAALVLPAAAARWVVPPTGPQLLPPLLQRTGSPPERAFGERR